MINVISAWMTSHFPLSPAHFKPLKLASPKKKKSTELSEIARTLTDSGPLNTQLVDGSTNKHSVRMFEEVSSGTSSLLAFFILFGIERQRGHDSSPFPRRLLFYIKFYTASLCFFCMFCVCSTPLKVSTAVPVRSLSASIRVEPFAKAFINDFMNDL